MVVQEARLVAGQTTASTEMVFPVSANASSGLRRLTWVERGQLYAPEFLEARQAFEPRALTILFDRLHVPGWRLLRRLTLSIVREAGQWTICDSVFSGVYGVGDDPEEALRDYQSALIQFYEDIVEWDGKLAPHLERQKTNLLEYLRREES